MHSYCCVHSNQLQGYQAVVPYKIQATKATLCILVFPSGWLWNSFFTIHWLVTGRRGNPPAIDTVRPAEQARQDYSVRLWLPARHTSHEHRHLRCGREMPARSLFSCIVSRSRWRGEGEEVCSREMAPGRQPKWGSPSPVQAVLKTGWRAQNGFRHDCKIISGQENKQTSSQPCLHLATRSGKMKHHVQWLFLDLCLTNLNNTKRLKGSLALTLDYFWHFKSNIFQNFVLCVFFSLAVILRELHKEKKVYLCSAMWMQIEDTLFSWKKKNLQANV